MIEGGFKLWAHKTLESEIFTEKPAEWFKIWFYIVMRAHFSDDKKLPRGSVYLKYEWIKSNLHVSRDQIAKFIQWSKQQSMLATRKATRGFVVSVLKFAEYQELGNYISNTKSNKKATQKQQDTQRRERRKRTVYINTTLATEAVAEKKERKKTTLTELVEYFFKVKAWPVESVAFRRYLRAGRDLLEACNGNLETAKQKIDSLHVWAEKQQLSWTLDTVVKRWFELEAETARDPEPRKRAFIGTDRAYQNARGDWMVILSTGEHRKWVGSLNELRYE